jgi:hypothetical protein
VLPDEPADRGRAAGRLFANSPDERLIQPIIDPLTGQAFPGNIIPQDRVHHGEQMLNLLPCQTASSMRGWSAVDAKRRTRHHPIHKRRNLIMRIDTV